MNTAPTVSGRGGDQKDNNNHRNGTAAPAATAALAEHALAYARAGIPVLPLQARSKIPATRHGKNDATTNVEQITQWWAKHPDHNIGLRPPTGHVVLDVDPRAHGATNLVALKTRAGGRFSPTLTAATGGGGMHIWLRATGPFKAQLCPGVDLKTGVAGYVVAPPSIHPNGRVYEWLNDEPVAYTPGWLLPLLRRSAPGTRLAAPPGAGAATGRGLVLAVRCADPGNRNNLLFWAACRAAETGQLDALHDQLAEAATANGLPHNEIQATLRSARTTPRTTPR